MSDLHPLSGAYAVNALDDLERVRFERHLLECADCATEVRSLQEAAGLLSLAVDPTPSPELRSRVLAEIHTVRPLPPMVRQREVAHRKARRLPRLVAAAVASVLLIGGIGFVADKAANDSGQPAPVAAPVSERVLDASDAKTQSIAFDDGSTATLTHSSSVGRAVLKTQAMADAPSGKVYELWFQKDNGAFVPAGLMTAGGDQTVLLHGKVSGSQGVGITVEPASGSEHPTSAPVALFKLSKSV